jgi:hypothetical protein
MPRPEITGLEFTEVSGVKAQWYTCLLQHSNWAGLVLNPGESNSITFSVRPNSVARPPQNDNSDYHRWSLGVVTGRYAVRYLMSVGPDYFDGDSHYRLSDVQREARQLTAHAWTGNTESNVISIDYREPPLVAGVA